jgi:predicted AlkP superfamily pyrophosphatase or phosphodiesterase
MRTQLLSIALIVALGCSQPASNVPVAGSAQAAALPSPAALHVAPRRVEAGPRPVEAIQRVLIISIDGLRPDLLLRAYMPRVRALCTAGCYTFWAETVPEAYTLPCHVSMLTGASSEKHGITWNNYIEESYSNVPTLFDVAREAGYTTAMVSGKMKFIVFARPGTLDYSYLPPDEPVSDLLVASQADGLLREHQPQVMFVHLPGVDTAGHDFGWGTTQQVAAIEEADKAVGMILDALSDVKLTDSTLVILTADHGGAAKGHEINDPRSHFIPWIASGPGLNENFDLTLQNNLRVHIEDTYATACAVLGIDPGGACTGKPVLEILRAPTRQLPGE